MIKLKSLLQENEEDPCYPFKNVKHATHFCNWIWSENPVSAQSLNPQKSFEFSTCAQINDTTKSAYNNYMGPYLKDQEKGYKAFKKSGGAGTGKEDEILGNIEDFDHSTVTSDQLANYLMMWKDDSPGLFGVPKNYWFGVIHIVSAIGAYVVFKKGIKIFGPLIGKLGGGTGQFMLDLWKAKTGDLSLKMIRAARKNNQALEVYVKDMVEVQNGKLLEAAKSIKDPKKQAEILKALRDPAAKKLAEKEIMDAIVVDASMSGMSKAEIKQALGSTLYKSYEEAIERAIAVNRERAQRLKDLGTPRNKPLD